MSDEDLEPDSEIANAYDDGPFRMPPVSPQKQVRAKKMTLWLCYSNSHGKAERYLRRLHRMYLCHDVATQNLNVEFAGDSAQ
jgi:hypothetical protein